MKKKTVCCSDLGAYINELLKRAKLKNEYVCETLGMGHDVEWHKKGLNLPLNDYIKVMNLCLNAYNEEEIELILNTLVRMYLRYYKKRIVE